MHKGKNKVHHAKISNIKQCHHDARISSINLGYPEGNFKDADDCNVRIYVKMAMVHVCLITSLEFLIPDN